jgi:hypothetical protein
MTHETLSPQLEHPPIDSFRNQQDALVQRLHSFQGGRPGDTYIGPIKIYREPEAFSLFMRNGSNVIRLDQTRCETNDLGVKSRITLTQETSTEHGTNRTTYRSDGTKAVKEEVNGTGPFVTEMDQDDFANAVDLLNTISLTIKLL